MRSASHILISCDSVLPAFPQLYPPVLNIGSDEKNKLFLRLRFHNDGAGSGSLAKTIHNKSSCGLPVAVVLVCFFFPRGFVSVAPFGFSKCERMFFARSRISIGNPASRATWMP